MRSLFTLVCIAGIFCLAACSRKNDKTTDYTLVPSADSVSKGSIIHLTFGTDSFTVSDLMVSGSPIVYEYGDVIFNINDSFWMGRLIVNDYQQKQFAMNLNVIDTLNPYYIDTGNYYVTTNTCTLTDYSHGENKTYTIVPGSFIHYTRTYHPVIGTMNLTLYYNHTYTTATGDFSVYQ